MAQKYESKYEGTGEGRIEINREANVDAAAGPTAVVGRASALQGYLAEKATPQDSAEMALSQDWEEMALSQDSEEMAPAQHLRKTVGIDVQ